MSGLTAPSNASNGATPTQVVVTGAPTRGTLALTLNEASAYVTQASLWALTATTPYGYTEVIPLKVMQVAPGFTERDEELVLDLAYYQSLFARLELIDPSQSVAASMTLTV